MHEQRVDYYYGNNNKSSFSNAGMLLKSGIAQVEFHGFQIEFCGIWNHLKCENCTFHLKSVEYYTDYTFHLRNLTSKFA